jgi:hypothetical protein
MISLRLTARGALVISQLEQSKSRAGRCSRWTIGLHDGATVEFNRAAITDDLMAHWMSFKDMLNPQEQLAQMKRFRNKLLRADLKTFQPVFRSA